MYFALFIQASQRMRKKLWQVAVMRSGLLMMVALMIVLVVLAFGWRQHSLGHFAQLKRELKLKEPVQSASAPSSRPGGQDVLLLQRSEITGENVPEFLSATVLPGRGSNVLQITANLPQRGIVSLLASPTVEEAARLMDGTGLDAVGGESLAMGGAIEAPWAGSISGTASADGKNLTAVWHGHRFTLPTLGGRGIGGADAKGGLLLKQASDSASMTAMPDGGEGQMSFHVGNFGGRWMSQTEMTTTVQLSSRAIEMTVVTRNTGNEAEPVGIGWQPRFAIVSGNREQATLRLPAAERVEVGDRRSGLPTGRLLPVAGTEYDFTEHGGKPLGALNLDDSFVNLRQAFMEVGPVAEMRDPASNYGLRLTAMSSNIKAMRVYAPVGEAFVSIDPRFNYDDPFGREWANGEDTGMVMLQPGQSVQWKIRLEIFSLTAGEARHP
jgi:aldose 1-epimerase